MKNKVIINGKLIENNSIGITLYSPSIRYGLILFEAMRLNYLGDGNYTILNLKKHLERFNYSCKIMSFNNPYSNLEIENMIKELVFAVNPQRLMGIRIFAYYDHECNFLTNDSITLAIYLLDIKDIKRFKECRLLISDYNKSINGMLPYGVKSSAHYAYSRICVLKANKCGFDDVVYLNDNNYITESSRSSLMIIKNKIVYFPLISDGVLSGITRKTIIDLCKILKIDCIEMSLTRENLYKADEIYLLGTSYGFVRVINIDGFDLNAVENSLGEKIREEYEKILNNKSEIGKNWLTYIKTEV
ncbi:MAG: aminotransferase class IV [Erysipelotrichaceae bacterium]|nr:aminotransferase class IV [Erysipelotrichaceae bacterium]